RRRSRGNSASNPSLRDERPSPTRDVLARPSLLGRGAGLFLFERADPQIPRARFSPSRLGWWTRPSDRGPLQSAHVRREGILRRRSRGNSASNPSLRDERPSPTRDVLARPSLLGRGAGLFLFERADPQIPRARFSPSRLGWWTRPSDRGPLQSAHVRREGILR